MSFFDEDNYDFFGADLFPEEDFDSANFPDYADELSDNLPNDFNDLSDYYAFGDATGGSSRTIDQMSDEELEAVLKDTSFPTATGNVSGSDIEKSSPGWLESVAKAIKANPIQAISVLGSLGLGAGTALGGILQSTARAQSPNFGNIQLTPEASEFQNIMLQDARRKAGLSALTDDLYREQLEGGAARDILTQNLEAAKGQAGLQNQLVSYANSQVGPMTAEGTAEMGLRGLGRDTMSGAINATPGTLEQAGTGYLTNYLSGNQAGLNSLLPYGKNPDLINRADELQLAALNAPGENDPTLVRQLEEDRRKLTDQYRQMLGGGFDTSTPFQVALAEFNKRATEILANDKLTRQNQRLQMYQNVSLPRQQQLENAYATRAGVANTATSNERGERQNVFNRGSVASGTNQSQQALMNLMNTARQGAPSSSSLVGSLFGADPNTIAAGGLSTLTNAGLGQGNINANLSAQNAQFSNQAKSDLLTGGSALLGYGLRSAQNSKLFGE